MRNINECLDDSTKLEMYREEIDEFIECYGVDESIVKILLLEYLNYENNADSFTSSYRGIFDNEIDFVREMVLQNESFPTYLEIDWEQTTDNYMQDCYKIEIYDNFYFFDCY